MTDFSKTVTGAVQGAISAVEEGVTTIVKAGQDLPKILSQLGVSADELKKANPQVDLNKLQPGTVLKVPGGDGKQTGAPPQNASAQAKQADRMTDAATSKAQVSGLQAAHMPAPPKYKDVTTITPSESACFHKVESLNSSPNYTGISGTATLPDVHIDPHRARPAENKPPLDCPSVYMGGNATSAKGLPGGREVDAGLSWDRVYTPKGEATWTNDQKGWTKPPSSNVYVQRGGKWQQLTLGKDGEEVSKKEVTPDELKNLHLQPNCAFRPYIRTMNQEPGASQDEKNAQWHTPHFKDNDGPVTPEKPANRYFYPGDKVKMSFGEDQQKGHVRLSIGKEGDPADKSFVMTQTQTGWPGDSRSFKRINSVDEHGGNGTPIPTHTQATHARWDHVQIDKKEGKPQPLDPDHARNVRDSHAGKSYNYKDVFHVRTTGSADLSSETIDITPPKPQPPKAQQHHS